MESTCKLSSRDHYVRRTLIVFALLLVKSMSTSRVMQSRSIAPHGPVAISSLSHAYCAMLRDCALRLLWLARSMVGMGIVLLSGCGTMQAYSGPQQADEATALITTIYRYFVLWDMGSCIYHVDGQRPGFFENQARILPGEHTVNVAYYSCPKPGAMCDCENASRTASVITFTAQAGHKYRVTGSGVFTTHAWIEDLDIHAVVGRVSD